MKKGDTLFEIYFDIEEDDNDKIIKSSCVVVEWKISSIQNRKDFFKSEKFVYLNNGISTRKFRFSEFDISKSLVYGNTKSSAIKKALARIPSEIKKINSYMSDDPEYYSQYIRAYSITIKSSLKRMLSSTQKSLQKKKL